MRRCSARWAWRICNGHRRNRSRYYGRHVRATCSMPPRAARSEAERLVIQLLRGAGIRGWQVNFRVGPFLVDIAIPEQRIAIEIDGWAFHSDQHAFQNDRTRQNKLALQGWQVLRFTWLDLTQHPDRVLAQIRAAISAR